MNKAPTAKSLPYKRLCARHPDYDGRTLETIELLYEGGWRVQRAAKRLCPKLVGENKDRHHARCSMAAYQPYFGQIIDEFVSELFGEPLTVHPAPDESDGQEKPAVYDDAFYKQFAEDADNEGAPFVEVMADGISAALRKCRGIIAVDAPPAVDVKTRAEEEAAGVRCYVYELPVEQIINWEMVEKTKSCFKWCVRCEVDKPQESPTSARDTTREVYTIWTLGPDGTAQWERYVAIKTPEKPEIRDDDVIPMDSSGTTSFKRIPLIPRDLPKGLWVGNKIGPQALEHFARRSALIGAQNASLVAIPFISRGSEVGTPGGALPSQIQQMPDRGADPKGQFDKKGWVALGSGDTLGFAEPEGKCYEIVDKQLDELRKDMFAVNHQMAASVRPTPGSIQRSGKSKEKDGESTSKVLRKLGAEVRHWAIQVYKCISDARGETVEWVAHGMTLFENDDREVLIDEAVKTAQIPIGSTQFRILHEQQLAKKILENATPEDLESINDEIEKNAKEAEKRRVEMEAAMHDASVEALKNPTPAPVAKPGGAIADPKPKHVERTPNGAPAT